MGNIKAEIISIENVHSDYYSIKLKPLEEFTWKAGQFVIVKMPESEINGKDKRTLSIASAPKEGFVMLGTRTGKEISEFKKELLSKKNGEIVELQGPIGNFVKRDDICPKILIAGGIGITPIRGLIKSLEDDKNCHTEIIYSARGYHMYLNELEEICKNNDTIKLSTTNSSEDTNKELDRIIENFGKEPYYYISGSVAMVKGIKEYLLEREIAKEKIIADMMTGY